MSQDRGSGNAIRPVYLVPQANLASYKTYQAAHPTPTPGTRHTTGNARARQHTTRPTRPARAQTYQRSSGSRVLPGDTEEQRF